MEGRGVALAKQAEEALNKKGFMSVFGIGKEEKFENAAELYTQSGHAYKVSNSFEEAGMMYEKACENFLLAGSKLDAIKSRTDAATAYGSASPPVTDKALESYQSVIDTLSIDGKFGQCARHYRAMAELCESDNDKESAFTHYENAASMFKNDSKKGEANKCLLKVATMASEGGDYLRGADIYETIAKESLETRLGAYSAKGYFFQALLCFMAGGDVVAAQQKLEEYSAIDYTFPTARESQFVTKLLEAWENNDGDAYGEACVDFDRISPLDPWKSSMLLAAKRRFAGGSGGGGGGGGGGDDDDDDESDDGIDLS